MATLRALGDASLRRLAIGHKNTLTCFFMQLRQRCSLRDMAADTFWKTSGWNSKGEVLEDDDFPFLKEVMFRLSQPGVRARVKPNSFDPIIATSPEFSPQKCSGGKETPLFQGKSRLVKYYILGRFEENPLCICIYIYMVVWRLYI